MIRVEQFEHFLVKGGTSGLGDNNIELGADLVDSLACDVQGGFMLTDALDANVGLLVHTVSYSPLDDSEVHIMLLASVETLVEALGVE